jgi:hypothetical protein
VPRRSLAIITLLLFAAIPAFAGRRIVPSTDRLPLGDWTYDAMVSLASDGLVPGYAARLFEGDRLFNRYEMAQIVALVIEQNRTLNMKQTALMDHLIAEFRPELMYFNPGVVGKWMDRSNITPPTGHPAWPLGYVQGTVVENTADDTELAVPYHISGFAHLAPHAFAVAILSDKEEKFFQQTRADKTPSKLFVRKIDSGSFWSVGRESLNWGPAYSGSVILSDNSPAFTQMCGSREVEFGKIFGRIKITEFATTFQHEGPRTYLFGRRYEKPFNRNWHLGISETAKTSFAPNPLIAVLPFYLYQAMFIKDDAKINTLYSTDLTYIADNGMQAYTEFGIDDMTSIRLFGKANQRPRKTGIVGGIYLPKVCTDDRLSTFRAEYVTIDRLTYGATRPEFPELAYTHDRQVIGSPIGPNAKAIYLRGERYFSDKFSAIGEYFNQWQTASGDPERGHQRVVSLMAAYDLRPDASIALRIAPFKTITPGKPSESGTEYELRASFGF